MNFQENSRSLLTFRVGPVLCCAPSLPVESIISPPKLTHPPGSDRAQPGIFRHGSHIVKVIDLRQRFGVEQEDQVTPGNLIITHFGDESFAFWVDQIMDVFDFPSEGWGALPAAIPREVFSRTLLLNNKIHLYAEFINFTKLHDLAYLKHYIQQLKQNEAESTDNTSAKNISQESTKVALTGKNKETIVPPTDLSVKTAEETTATNINHSNSTIKAQPDKTTDHIKQKSKTLFENIKTIEVPITKTITSSAKEKATNIATADKNIDANKPDEISAKKYAPQNPASVSKPSPSSKPVPDSNRDTFLNNDVLHSRPEPISPATVTPGIQNNYDKKISATVQQTHTDSFTKAETTIENRDDETSSSLLAIIFIVLLLAVLGAGIYLFIFPERQTQPVIATAPASQIETNVQQVTTEENFFNTTVEKTPKVKTVTTAEKVPQVPEAKSQPETTTTPSYHAEITHRENEITITIHEPGVEEKTGKTATNKEQITEIKSEPGTAKQIINADTFNETLPESSSVEPLKQDELTKTIAPEKPVREIIHIVVKGDTLWAIAKKYVHNPFLYPELARLSNIKNPHRIYPGDRVRIRFVKNKK